MSVNTLVPTASFVGHKGSVYALCQGQLPGEFLSAGGDGVVVRWQLDAPDQGDALVHVGTPIFSLHLLPTMNLLLIGTGTGRLVVVDLHTRREVQVLDAHTKGIFRIVPLSTNTLACAGGDGVLSTWTIERSEEPRLVPARMIPLCEEKLRDIVVSRATDRSIVACGDGSLRMLDLPNLQEVQRFQWHEKGALCALFHPTKSVVLSGGKDGLVKAWRSDGACLLEFAAHKGPVYAIAFDPAGCYLATAGRDSLLKLWDATTMEPIRRSAREKKAHTHSINAMRWVGHTLITAGDDRRIHGFSL